MLPRGGVRFGSVPNVDDADVAAVVRDFGVVSAVFAGMVGGGDEAIIVTDVSIPDNASRSFMQATPEDCDARWRRPANSFDDPAGRGPDTYDNYVVIHERAEKRCNAHAGSQYHGRSFHIGVDTSIAQHARQPSTY